MLSIQQTGHHDPVANRTVLNEIKLPVTVFEIVDYCSISSTSWAVQISELQYPTSVGSDLISIKIESNLLEDTTIFNSILIIKYATYLYLSIYNL